MAAKPPDPSLLLEQIEQLLVRESRKSGAEASEFVHSLSFVRRILQGARALSAADAENVQHIADRYRTTVARLLTTNDLKRVMTTTRLLEGLETVNYRLLGTVQTLASNFGFKLDKAALDEMHTQFVPDAVGRDWWLQMFSPMHLQVTWDAFSSSFSSFLKALSPPVLLTASDLSVIRYILDTNNTGSVGMWKYGELVKSFGNPPAQITKLRSVFAVRWFKGFASSGESERLLTGQPIGTFLCRFAKARAGMLALAFKDSATTYRHAVITSLGGEYQLDNQRFPSLQQLAAAYSRLLSRPLETSLLDDPNFFGDISGSEASELLSTRRLGDYLWRYSSKAGFLALSYVASEEPFQAKHLLVEQLPFANAYRIETDTVSYPSLAAVVAGLPRLRLISPILHLTWTPPSQTLTREPSSSSLEATAASLPSLSWAEHRGGMYADLDSERAGHHFVPPARPMPAAPVTASPVKSPRVPEPPPALPDTTRAATSTGRADSTSPPLARLPQSASSTAVSPRPILLGGQRPSFSSPSSSDLNRGSSPPSPHGPPAGLAARGPRTPGADREAGYDRMPAPSPGALELYLREKEGSPPATASSSDSDLVPSVSPPLSESPRPSPITHPLALLPRLKPDGRAAENLVRVESAPATMPIAPSLGSRKPSPHSAPSSVQDEHPISSSPRAADAAGQEWRTRPTQFTATQPAPAVPPAVPGSVSSPLLLSQEAPRRKGTMDLPPSARLVQQHKPLPPPPGARFALPSRNSAEREQPVQWVLMPALPDSSPPVRPLGPATPPLPPAASKMQWRPIKPSAAAVPPPPSSPGGSTGKPKQLYIDHDM